MFLKKYLNLWNWTFEYGVFRFFANFWVAKLKRLSVKARQSVKNCSKQNLVIRSLLETGFGAILRSKMNVLNLWKWHFSVFYKFVRDEIESAFWENEVNRSKLFKAKVGHRKNLRKWFWSYLEVKKMNVLSILWTFEDELLKRKTFDEIESVFWQNNAKRLKLFKSKLGHRKNFRKWFWSHFEVKDKCSEPLEMGFFTFLQIFEWRSWNCLLEKRGKALKTV